MICVYLRRTRHQLVVVIKQMVYWWTCRLSAHPSLLLVSPPVHQDVLQVVKHIIHSWARLSFHPFDLFFHLTPHGSPCIFSRTRLLLCGLNVPHPLAINKSGQWCDHSPSHALTSLWGRENSLTAARSSSLLVIFSSLLTRDRCACMYYCRNMQTQWSSCVCTVHCSVSWNFFPYAQHSQINEDKV